MDPVWNYMGFAILGSVIALGAIGVAFALSAIELDDSERPR